ncbi:MAG TPA: glycosyltransferase family 39 protein, partial [Urbifossiella sp.]
MAVGVCVLVFALAVAGVAAARDRLGVGHSLREAVLVAAALVGGFVVAVTEGLGALGELRFGPVLGCWLAAAFLLTCGVADHREKLAGWWQPTLPFHWSELGLLSLIILIVGTSGLIAALCPPNNFDVALYHLPRQFQWIQQGGVAHFPTQDYRLTVNPPFAEFVGTHFMLLSGTDWLATVESWLSMIMALGAISLVGRELGLSRCGQMLAALFAATVPVGFHEATNGKNDWMVAFWLAATLFWVLRVWKAECIRPVEAIGAGLSLGLLILTKGTGGIFAVPLVIMGGLGLVLRRPRGWISALLAVAALTVLSNLGHWSRNYHAYGSISGKTFGLDNERHTPAVWASGLVRNVGVHLAS